VNALMSPLRAAASAALAAFTNSVFALLDLQVSWVPKMAARLLEMPHLRRPGAGSRGGV
jgi:hypothetical protein